MNFALFVATVYGKGVYFAVNASYSHNYSKPDDNGNRFMYLCKVLTGVYTQGDSSMLVPPARDDSNKAVRYDSVVNDMTKPDMYVVFSDHRSYVEYLVQYTC